VRARVSSTFYVADSDERSLTLNEASAMLAGSEAALFRREIETRMAEFNLRCIALVPAIGLWAEDEYDVTVEPSFTVDVEGNLLAISAFASTLGLYSRTKYGRAQSAVLVYQSEEHGTGFEFSLQITENREDAWEILHRNGIPGGRFEGDRFVFAAGSNAFHDRLAAACAELGVTPEVRPGNFKLVPESDFEQHLSDYDRQSNHGEEFSEDEERHNYARHDRGEIPSC
jgi:hypothetical protein